MKCSSMSRWSVQWSFAFAADKLPNLNFCFAIIQPVMHGEVDDMMLKKNAQRGTSKMAYVRNLVPAVLENNWKFARKK